ncbi:cysteine desulfurase-like protein [Candidatus Bipolaricaulota bacterium]|nr:cysteine desulfurase-like protein [Candidatus Bipolaricaulota bacterium]
MPLTQDHVMELRREFPALGQTLDGQSIAFFDGPGGTQVHRTVIEAFARYYTEANSNAHGAFEFSRRTDRTVLAARAAMADFFNAKRPDEIVFGQSMTSLTFNLSRAIGHILSPGDEIIVTRLDHDANVAPWVALEELGIVIRTIDFNPQDCTLDLEAMRTAIGPKTRLVAVGAASNAVGTVNDVAQIVPWAHDVGAWVFVDAVQYAPHAVMDVQDWNIDFLACSAYKFFGPHLGVLWGRYELLDKLPAYKVIPAMDVPPDKFQSGTPNFEAMAGATAAIDYIASVGRRFGGTAPNVSRRAALVAGMTAIQEYETALAGRLIAGLQPIPGIRVYGITEPARFDERLPVVSFTLKGHAPVDVARTLGDAGLFAYCGDFYAVGAIERLDLAATGGLIRIGINHYNTADEVDRLLGLIREIAG